MDEQRIAVAVLSRELRHLSDDALRYLAASEAATIASVARAVLDLRPQPDIEALRRAVFPPAI